MILAIIYVHKMNVLEYIFHIALKFRINIFLLDLNIFVILYKGEEKKNVKKIGQFSGTNILRTSKAISFNFDM